MKKITIFIFALVATVSMKAQEISDKQIDAFASSYKAEASKEYDKAINELKANYVYSEKSYEINLRLGWLYFAKGDNQNSEVYYKTACINNPNSIEALLGYVYPLYASQNWTLLMETYNKILKLDPNHALANYRLGLMLYNKKDYLECEKHLKKVLEHYPFDFDSILLLAQSKMAAGKMAEAKSYYLRAQLYNPSSEEIKKALSKL